MNDQLGVPPKIINDFPLIGDPSYAHRIMGSPGGKHCESLGGNVRSKAVFFDKNFDFGKRVTLFRRYFIRNGVEQS